MDAATLEALKGSIAKWEAIVAGTGEDFGVENCPLCKIFYEPEDPTADDCTGCPVRGATDLPACDGTPYDKYRATSGIVAKHRAAKEELEFLRSLLPAESDA